MNNDFEYRRRDTNRPRFRYNLKVFAIIIGIVIGVWTATRFVSASGTLLSEVKKITAIMNLIKSTYVNDPDLDRLSEGAIEGMLKRLDPHSIYIPPAEQEKIAEVDQGEFEGIGISFVIQNELITVISPITGTPAERLGIRSGDRIIEIDGENAFGITSEEVFKKLRGPKGTTVKVKIAREGVPEPLDFTIIRDTIPVHSVWTSFMIDDSTGYILLNQFTATTTQELEEALKKLESSGMTRLLFDLRNNQGGRLSQAVAVADLFIPDNHVLVSKVGRDERQDSVFYSTDDATHPMFDLIVLINSGSASASEIVAGAIQDLDRGLIVGRNSFGKGLVQYPYLMQDGGVIRLSIAHWYTPVGRLVQRPYDKGRGEYYAVRYRDPDAEEESGNREEFKTLGGRTVYSSSGIAPDVKVEDGTILAATVRLMSERVIFAYAEEMVKGYDLHPNQDFREFRDNFTISDEDLKGLQAYAATKEIEYPDEALERDRDYLAVQIKAEVAQLLWSNRDYYYLIRILDDQVVKRALELFEEAREVSTVWR